MVSGTVELLSAGLLCAGGAGLVEDCSGDPQAHTETVAITAVSRNMFRIPYLPAWETMALKPDHPVDNLLSA
jgi:hypothetical protein